MRTVPLRPLLVIAVVGASACGGAATPVQDAPVAEPAVTSAPVAPTTPAAQAGPHGPRLEASIHLEGAVALDGDYTVVDTLSGSCAAVGESGNLRSAGTARRFEVPMPMLRSGREVVEVSSSLERVEFSGFLIARDYTGPGTYGPEAFTGEELSGTEGEFMLGVTTSDLDATFEPTDDSTVSLVVEADGSGRLDFEGVRDADAGEAAGFVTWDCVDA